MWAAEKNKGYSLFFGRVASRVKEILVISHLLCFFDERILMKLYIIIAFTSEFTIIDNRGFTWVSEQILVIYKKNAILKNI